MGVTLGLNTIRDENIDRVLADPPLIFKVIAPDDPEAYERARPKPGLLARLLGKRPPAPGELVLSEAEAASADLDKSWHGIHWLLTGSASEGEWPLGFLLQGGTQVGTLEVGYGPARVLRSAEVRDVAEALRGIDAAALRSRFDGRAMMDAGVYPEIWDRDPETDDPAGYCIGYYEELKEFLTQAANRGLGVVVYA